MSYFQPRIVQKWATFYQPKESFLKGHMLATLGKKAPLCSKIRRHWGYELGVFLWEFWKTQHLVFLVFRGVLQRFCFIDCNFQCLLYQGKLCDNVCVYESVNTCVWQWKCVFDLAGLLELMPCLWDCKHTLGHVVVNGLCMPKDTFTLEVMYRVCHHMWFGIFHKLCLESLPCGIYRKYFETSSFSSAKCERERHDNKV